MQTTIKRRPKLEAFARQALDERRRALMAARELAEKSARELYETRETDWEDRAANVAAAGDLDRLGDTERMELRRVTTALERMDAGAWGTCVRCSGPIDEGRLRVVPEADRCVRCTDHAEA